MDAKKQELFYQSVFDDLSSIDPKFSKLRNDNWKDIIDYSHQMARSFTKKNVQTKRYGLADIFNNFGTVSSKRTIISKKLAGTEVKFKSGKVEIEAGDYTALVKGLGDKLQNISFEEDSTQKTLNVLQDYWSFLPAEIGDEKSLDISLYEYAKLALAFSQVLEAYLTETRTKFDSKKLDDTAAFLLVSFDISGIQNFIYKITTNGAYKQLRSRSFYLDMISEWISDSLLRKCGLTRANLIYSGGGHAYLLLPNTKQVLTKIDELEEATNAFFLERFGIDLYVAFGSESFVPNDIKRGNTNAYRHIYQNLSRKLSDKKLNRYTGQQLKQLNVMGKRTGRECKVCHTVDNLTNDGLCYLCLQLQNFSKNIQNDDYFVVNDQEKDGLAVAANCYLHKVDQNDVKNKNYTGVLYAKNVFGDDSGAIRIMAGDYAATDKNELSYYVERTEGLQKIAALRCDADDLGYAFMAGFSGQDGGIYNTFARSAEFSHNLSMFFKYHINQIANGKKLMIIYSGGDDVFLLGAWDEVIAFAVELREKFQEWTNGKITLSSGIALFDETTPINIVARETGVLEDIAKDNGKDSICLFEDSFVYKYDEFIQNVYTSKLPFIREFFETQNERGNSFIYKLLDLIRERKQGKKITFARLVYYLTRLEDFIDKSKDKQQALQAFKKFKEQMNIWFASDTEILEVELALMLYVYEKRKDD